MPTSSVMLQASRRIRPIKIPTSRSVFLEFHHTSTLHGNPNGIQASYPSTRIISRHASQTIGSTHAHHFQASSNKNDSAFLYMAASAAALAALSSTCAHSANNNNHIHFPITTNCESPPSSLLNESISGPADETEDSSSSSNNNNNNNDGSILIRDGMDAGSETPHPHSLLSSNESAAEDEVDDDDDPANDEETTCSICLINRQGPCRRYWLKFERCMKEHSAEKERRELEQKREEEKEKEEKMMNVKEERVSDDGNDEMTMEEEWDRFMEKSVMPGEEEEDEEEEDDEEEDDENSNNEENDNAIDDDDNDEQNNTEPSLGERCDKFMIPWISCIQEHRNVYSLISNAFYQKDYVDPLEESVPDHKRRPFTKVDAAIGEKEGYVVKFMGAEVDLGNWREHVEAQAEEDFSVDEEEEEKALQRETTHKKMEDPHLINAYAKFKLTEPKTGNPIEVAYIKDQKGRLLGFDSFSKRESAPENDEDEEQMHSGREKVHDGSTMEHGKIHDGECTFHIEPGETTSVAAYAIYRSKKVDDKGEEQREYVLYYTPHIPLPGNQSGK